MADGSVDPPTAPIQRDGDIYTLTSNIHTDYGFDGIVVQRENIVIDGAYYTVGSSSMGGTGSGIATREINNVTIKNVRIVGFNYGILLHGSSESSIIENEVTWNLIGINIRYSSNSNMILGNKVFDYNGDGIRLSFSCSDNIISENNITNNDYGINLLECSNNIICKNDITNNWVGTDPWDSPNNIYYHNNFINNIHQARGYASVNTWDNGYPSGGNYWSEYSTIYPDAQELDDSGIWDTPYVIAENNQDNYPLMNPWSLPEVPPVEDTEAYIEYVNETQQDLQDGIFSRPEEDVPDVKNDFSDLFDDALENIDEGNYERAIEKLDRIKTKMYGAMVESAERQEIISLIDDLIAYLETFL